MQLDGQYAAAQLWKLDTFNGYDIPLYAVLGEYLMLPQFPSARFKAWIEQYDRLPDVSTRVSFYLLPDEEFPQHLSERATVTCKVLDIIDGVQTWIEYHGSVAQYLSQRWEIWDAFLPTCVKITDVLTDEEQAYFDEWHNRYACPWPLVMDSGGLASISAITAQTCALTLSSAVSMTGISHIVGLGRQRSSTSPTTGTTSTLWWIITTARCTPAPRTIRLAGLSGTSGRGALISGMCSA